MQVHKRPFNTRCDGAMLNILSQNGYGQRANHEGPTKHDMR